MAHRGSLPEESDGESYLQQPVDSSRNFKRSSNRRVRIESKPTEMEFPEQIQPPPEPPVTRNPRKYSLKKIANVFPKRFSSRRRQAKSESTEMEYPESFEPPRRASMKKRIANATRTLKRLSGRRRAKSESTEMENPEQIQPPITRDATRNPRRYSLKKIANAFPKRLSLRRRSLPTEMENPEQIEYQEDKRVPVDLPKHWAFAYEVYPHLFKKPEREYSLKKIANAIPKRLSSRRRQAASESTEMENPEQIQERKMRRSLRHRNPDPVPPPETPKNPRKKSSIEKITNFFRRKK